jgi:hypothetical protein
MDATYANLTSQTNENSHLPPSFTPSVAAKRRKERKSSNHGLSAIASATADKLKPFSYPTNANQTVPNGTLTVPL